MCGIAGIFGTDDSSILEKVDKMTDLLAHRGPDGEGKFIESNQKLALGHRRLSILDPAPRSDQPYRTKSGRSIMVYNGEVYNFRQLAEKYKLDLVTTGDTEVIAELIEIKGHEIIAEFNGMFAIAFYSYDSSELLIARDRYGIKPLYYSYQRGVIYFSSELRSIYETSSSLSLDEQALWNFLELGFLPKDSTIYKEVNKLLPGQCLRVGEDEKKLFSYVAREPLELDLDLNEAALRTEFSSRFSRSVQRRMISDRPIGVFLSGGTDSSLISAYAREYSEGKLKTFSVAVNNEAYNESKYAEKVAGILGTDHETIEVSERDLIESIDDIVGQLDEPFGDSSYIPFHILSQHAVNSFNVALSGDGADELFQGYGMYRWADRLSKFRWGLQAPIEKVVEKLKNDPQKDYSKYFRFKTKKEIPQVIFGQEQCAFHSSEVQALMKGATKPARIYSYSDSLERHRSAREKQAWADFNNYLVDDLLLKVDRASMYNSLEVRVPFLDREVVEFAWSLPLRYKYHKGISKYLLKTDLERFLPRELVHRKKWGFSIPLKEWLHSELRHLILPLESDEYLDLIPFLDKNIIKDLVSRYIGGQHYLYNRLWLLLQVYRWVEKHDKVELRRV